MPEFTIKQFKSQSDSWKRSLQYMMEENAFLKERLSNMLMNGIDTQALEQLEHFHSRFLCEDQLLSLLRDDVRELDMMLVNDVFQEEQLTRQTLAKLKDITSNMQIVEIGFSKLASEFNNYLLEYMHIMPG
jgi:hypothetical protein